MAMGWTNSHLHHFIIGMRPNARYIGFGPIDEWDDAVDEENEDEVLINEVLPSAKTKMIYEYDFGDSWEHEVVLEKVLEAEAGVSYPRCVAGENACPPEDVGGVWGYAEFLRAISDPKHKERKSYLEWVGGEFDPEEFDLEAVNRLLGGRQNYKMFGRGLD